MSFSLTPALEDASTDDAIYAPSLDRIIPEKGYVKGNVRIIVYQLNVALSEFGLEQFNNFINLYITNSDVVYR